MAPHLQYRSPESDDFGAVTAVRFASPRVSLDGANTPALAEALFRLAEEGRQELRLDLQNVEFVGATALGMLVTLRRRLLATGGRLRLYHLQPLIAEVFRVARLDRLLDLRTGPLEAPPEAARLQTA